MADTYAIGLDACSSGWAVCINRHKLAINRHLCSSGVDGGEVAAQAIFLSRTAPNGLYLVGVGYPAQFPIAEFAPGPVFLAPDPA